MLHHYLSRLPHFFQSTCLLCNCGIENRLDDFRRFGLCHYCHANLPFLGNRCSICSIPLHASESICGQCISTPPAFDKICCPLLYSHHAPKLIHQLKTRHDKAIARLLVEFMTQCIQLSKLQIDCITPTPMHWQRNLQKGNNQTYLLAQPLGKALQLPVNTALVQRTHKAQTQKQLNAIERQNNLKQAFNCSTKITGLRIAVVDDVITTGSTMNAIAQTLKNAGAHEVHCWAVARTPKH